MSYIVIPVYDFACDEPGCPHTLEVTPANMGSPSDSLLTIAHRLIRKDGWTARRNAAERRWEHWCHEHPQATQ